MFVVPFPSPASSHINMCYLYCAMELQLLIMLLALFTKPKSFWDDCEGEAGFGAADPQVGALADRRKQGRQGLPVNAGGCGDDVDLSGGAMKLGVLRVMAACLDSIAAALSRPEHAPSRDLLMKYFTQQTVANISSILEDEGRNGFIDQSALPLFLQIAATVWKYKQDADRDELTDFADAAVDQFLSHSDQYPRQLQCSYAVAMARLCRGNAPLLFTTITKPFVDLENWLVQGTPASPPLAAIPLRAAVDVFGAAITDGEVTADLDDVLPYLRRVIDAVFAHDDVDALATLLREDASGSGNGASIGQCLVRAVQSWTTFAVSANQATRGSADGATSLLGDLLGWVSTTLLPTIGRRSSAVDKGADAYPEHVLYDMLASILLVVTDALIIGSIQQRDQIALEAVVKGVLLSLDHIQQSKPVVNLSGVFCRLESALCLQYTYECDAECTTSVAKVISALGGGSSNQ